MSETPERRNDWTLVIADAHLAIPEGSYRRIGSSPESDVRLTHGSVSPQHAIVSCLGGRITVQDQDSEQGTYVGDERVQRRELGASAVLRFGSIEVQLLPPSGMPVMPVPRAGAHARLSINDRSFSELMADNLRSAPWFTLSALIHAVLALILYYLLDEPPGTPDPKATLVFQEGQYEQELPDPDEETTADFRTDEILPDIEPLDPFNESFEATSESEDDDNRFDDFEEDERIGSTDFAPGAHWLAEVGTASKSGSGVLSNAKVRSGGFGKTVSRMRRTGLEIVFVFDSTGSMGSILRGTKERIAHMVEMLYALIPDARIGLVTYRDRDPEEDYLTRKVPLSSDKYRAINFMQVIEAGGGGSRPEAVLDGLREAFGQSWARRARRVVVLIGDAPAHSYDEERIDKMVRSFAKDGDSFVHSIMTSPSKGRRPREDTRASFRRIAEEGEGECIAFEDNTRVLRQVLSLAFGRQYRSNIDEVSRVIEKQNNTVATYALDMVHREDVNEIRQQLYGRTIDDNLVKALARSNSPKVAAELVDLLTKPSLSQGARQATLYALARMLEGRLAREVLDILVSNAEEGRGQRRKDWQLRPLSRDRARLLLRAIERG